MHTDLQFREPQNQKPPKPGYQVEAETQSFFKTGYEYFSLSSNEATTRLISALKTLENSNPDEPYLWKEKYPRAFDIYPNTYSYLPYFVDFLFAQNIPQRIRTFLSEDLYLGDLTLRRVGAGQQYSGWHRDTNVYDSNSKGRMPVLHKLIFYPQLGRPSTPQLKIIPGSHRRMFSNRHIDSLQTRILPKVRIASSDNHALFFNTGLFHSAEAVQTEHPSFRLIYCFCYKYQLSQFGGREALHEIYQKRLFNE